MKELYTLALDLRRSSSSYANELWKMVDPQLWDQTRNPWMIVQTLSARRSQELDNDPSFQKLLKRTYGKVGKSAQWIKVV